MVINADGYDGMMVITMMMSMVIAMAKATMMIIVGDDKCDNDKYDDAEISTMYTLKKSTNFDVFRTCSTSTRIAWTRS